MRNFKKLSVLSALLLAASFSALAAPPVGPVADRSCAISPEKRAQRIAFVDETLTKLAGLSAVTDKNLRVLNDALESMNEAQAEAKVCLGISMVAGTIAGVGAVYEVFFAGEAVTFFGITSTTVIRTVTAVGAASRTITIPTGIWFLLNDHEVRADTLPEAQRQQVANIQDQPLLSPTVMNFLSSDDCSGERCKETDQPQIEDSWRRLTAWHDAEEKRLEDTDGHWYNPLSWEWHSHHYARSLAEVEIPWATNIADLLKLKRAYYDLLKQILVHDQAACGG